MAEGKKIAGIATCCALFLLGACGGNSSTPVDAGADQLINSDSSLIDAATADSTADVNVGADQSGADAKSADAAAADKGVTDLSTGADVSASSPYDDLDWVSSRYIGGFNPHTQKSNLKSRALTMSLTAMAGNPRSCTATLDVKAIATLLIAAANVPWVSIKSTYVPKTGCGYPGNSGEITVTLHLKTGKSQIVSTKWCDLSSVPDGRPKDFTAFIAAKVQAEKTVCPNI